MKHPFLGLFLLFAGSCIAAQSEPADSLSSSKITSDSALQSVNTAHPLPFKAGDALSIVTYPDTNAFPKGFYPIDGDGYVDFPIIGYLQVTKLSAEELTKLLAEKYVDYMRYPLMTIRPVIRITFSGGFFKPGLYWVNPNASLWEALQFAGGAQRMDGYKKMKWERNNTMVNDNLAPFLQDGKSLYQIGFVSGDQITILQQPFRTKWDVFRGDVIPLITSSLSIVISALTLYYTSQYRR